MYGLIIQKHEYPKMGQRMYAYETRWLKSDFIRRLNEPNFSCISGPCIGMDCLHGVLMHGDDHQGEKHVAEDQYLR